ncbi:hypothetical protein [Psychrobacter sp. GP33]|uniref:hypothetical protein n=1 Tax=Psychrobacter sp. GP33 TaxID=2758709 RepID=UPI0015FBE757|nr:hypothetical protein [Psychrobacter sp. GP33]
MTYLAPRQGLFAIIVLVSFCLQTLLLVISTDQQLTKNREQKGEQTISQLIDESRLSLENKDRVSLSVIANRYTSEQDIASLVIKDGKGEVLVPVGNAPMQKGITLTQIATEGDAVIGSVALTLKDISKGEIIAMQWPFVIGSLIFHLLLWVAYGYIARPTKEQINALSRDIDNFRRRNPGNNTGTDNDSISSGRLSHTTFGEGQAVHSEMDNYLQTQHTHEQNVPSFIKNSSASSSDTAYNKIDEDNAVMPNVAKLSATRAFDSVSVQIMFHDEYRMLERLTPEMRIPYLALCTQLFNQALTELLKQPLLSGVSAVNSPVFDEHGACAVLKANSSHAKVALAGVMLAKLYLMLNKIIHDKHIELSRFALPAKAGVSDQELAMKQLLKTVGRKEQLLILVPNAGLKQIGNHVQVQNIKRPTTVYERECVVFDGGNAAMMERLADVRDAVLMGGN